MRLVMIGTGPFGAPTYRALYGSDHEVVALVTGPIRQRRGRPPVPTPMRDIAEQHGTPVFDPEDINVVSAQDQLRQFEADLLVVCDFGQILSAATLSTARLGGVNLHGSLLPKYRGAAPINWAIYDGETETGVSVIHMTPQVDAGPVIAQAKLTIGPDETAAELEPRLAGLGGPVVIEAVNSLAAGRAEPVPQDKSLASKAPRLKKTDGLIDWSRSAAEIRNQIRAFQPWPKSYTFWHRADGSPLRLIVDSVALFEPLGAGAPPGTVLEASEQLLVAAGQGAVGLETVQPSGRRVLPVGEFLRGYRVEPGDRLGPE